MKYVLILYVCSFINATNPNCTDSHVIPLEFQKYSDCILQGYKSAHNTLISSYLTRIDDEKLAIKFQCREVGKNA